MAVNVPGVLAGAVAGVVASEVVDRTRDKVENGARDLSGNPAPPGPDDHMAALVQLAASIEGLIRKAQESACPERDVIIQLTTTSPYMLTRRGYKHVSLLTATAFTAVVQTMVGNVNFAMSAGWNGFDLPDKSSVLLQAGGPLNVLLRFGNDALDIAGV